MKNPWERIYKEGIFDKKPHPEIKKVTDFFYKNQTNRILDLGCGAGRNLIYLADKGFELYGLDSSSTGLKYTINRLNEKKLSAHLTLHDMVSLPYGSEYFDAVISIQVIHHNIVKDIEVTVREITRVLKYKGLIWITMPVSKNEPGIKQKEIEPRTFIPLNGPEKGLEHHYFKEEEIPLLFSKFSVIDFHIDQTKHFSFLARKVLK